MFAHYLAEFEGILSECYALRVWRVKHDSWHATACRGSLGDTRPDCKRRQFRTYSTTTHKYYVARLGCVRLKVNTHRAPGCTDSVLFILLYLRHNGVIFMKYCGFENFCYRMLPPYMCSMCVTKFFFYIYVKLLHYEALYCYMIVIYGLSFTRSVCRYDAVILITIL